MKKVFSVSDIPIFSSLFHKITANLKERKKAGAIPWGNIYVTLIFALIGILLVTQLRGQASVVKLLSAQKEEELGQIISDLTQETEALRRQVTDLTVQLFRYDQTAADKKAILEQAAKNLENLETASGLTAVTGRGIALTIEDKEGYLNNYDLLDTIQELRAAGAEAISTNNHRVVASTTFGVNKSSVTIDNSPVKPPYEIKAIGNPEILEQAITILGGVKDTFNSFEGVSLEISQSQVNIPPVKNKMKFEVAKPLKNSS